MSRLRKLLDESVIALLRHRLPDRVVGYLSYQRRRKTRRRVEAFLDSQGIDPDEIMRGPFRSMKLPPKEIFFDSRFEKVFGFYEHELFEAIECIATETPPYDSVVVAGAADGFYAVGLALKVPASVVTAFELNDFRQSVLKRTIEINSISERVVIKGRCDPVVLEETLRQARKPLLVCDVDGYEGDLLDKDLVPALARATMVVETHDCFVENVSEDLKSRFSKTHHIEELQMSGTEFADVSFLAGMSMHEIDSLTGSERPQLQTWLVMRPVSE